MTTKTRASADDESILDLYLMKVELQEDEARAAKARRTLSGLASSSPRTPLAELTAADVEAYLGGLRWRGVSEDERVAARERCEAFVRFAVRVEAEAPRRRRPSDEAEDARPGREPGKRHRKAWLGPLSSVLEATRLLARDPASAMVAAAGAWLLGALVPVLGAGPAGVGMAHVMARLEEEGRVDASEVLRGFGRLLSSVFASLVQLVAVGMVAAVGVGSAWALLWLGEAAQGLGELPTWLTGAALVVLAVTAVAALLVANGFLFVYPLIARRRLGALEACDASWEAVRDHWVQILLVEIVFALVACVCNVVPVVGAIVTLGLWHALSWVLYRKLFE